MENTILIHPEMFKRIEKLKLATKYCLVQPLDFYINEALKKDKK